MCIRDSSDIVTREGGDEDAALRMAASVESQSQHPIAQGIVAAATGKGIAFPAPEGLQSITGAGVTARVDGQEAVSYTHLDVYKRQVRQHGRHGPFRHEHG